MYLKSVTLRGFKSFASATHIPFEAGLNVVVGPNGAGKSNLVDALAWVLGAQGVKGLRGAAMKDLIFSGAQGSKGLGRAKVELVLDNSSARLPYSGAEVKLCRTIFSSGGSEYEINGKAVRLSDLQDLLAEAGLGRELHTLVGQGQVDQIMHGSPLDRRQLLEEAAGLTKHRNRQAKAKSRLEDLKGKVERLEGLAQDLEEQLEERADQAQAASQAQDLAAQERRYLSALYYLEGRELADQLQQTRQALAQAQEESRQAQKKQASAQNQARALQAQAQELGQQAAQKAKTLQQLEGLISQLQGLELLSKERSRPRPAQGLQALFEARERAEQRSRQEETALSQAQKDLNLAQAAYLEAAGKQGRLSLPVDEDSLEQKLQLAQQKSLEAQDRQQGYQKHISEVKESLQALALDIKSQEARYQALQEAGEQAGPGLGDRPQEIQQALAQGASPLLDLLQIDPYWRAAILNLLGPLAQVLAQPEGQPISQQVSQLHHDLSSTSPRAEGKTNLLADQQAEDQQTADQPKQQPALLSLYSQLQGPQPIIQALKSSLGQVYLIEDETRSSINQLLTENPNLTLLSAQGSIYRSSYTLHLTTGSQTIASNLDKEQTLKALKSKQDTEQETLKTLASLTQKHQQALGQEESSTEEVRRLESLKTLAQALNQAFNALKAATERLTQAQENQQAQEKALQDQQAAVEREEKDRHRARQQLAQVQALLSASHTLHSQLKPAQQKLSQQSTNLKNQAASYQNTVTKSQQEQTQALLAHTRASAQISSLENQQQSLEEKTQDRLSLSLSSLLTKSQKPQLTAQQLKNQLKKVQEELQQLGITNPLALEEYRALEDRYSYLQEQIEDIKKSRADVQAVIYEVSQQIDNSFSSAFSDTQKHFQRIIPRLFPGGQGNITLTDPAHPESSGIELSISPAGKKVTRLSLLSGGERALASLGLLLALFLARPAPFYVLDEVDAALDDRNLGRLLDLLPEIHKNSQIIMISHHQRTMTQAKTLYGISIKEGKSSLFSYRPE